MKLNHFSLNTDSRFTGNKYMEDKPLFLGHRLSFLLGTPPKTIFLGEVNYIKTSILFNWRTHVTKTLDVI